MKGYSMFNYKKDATKENLKELIELVRDNILSQDEKDGSYTKLEIKNFGRLLEGTAYYHEVDQFYNCIGLEVEVESQFNFQDKPETDIGFFSVWKGKSHEVAPFTFEESYSGELGKPHEFTNGFGDHIKVTKELASVEEVQNFIHDNEILIN